VPAVSDDAGMSSAGSWKLLAPDAMAGLGRRGEGAGCREDRELSFCFRRTCGLSKEA
jgi:hypothetical protein